MIHNTPPLTTVQQCVVNALAAGSTLCDAAKQYGVHRVTVYRWMKTSRPFTGALHRARAEFVLARRDDLHKLSNLAVEILFKILENPKSSPAVLLRTAMFILQRPQLPKTGWTMPEPAPIPDDNKLLNSAIIEQDYASLPGLAYIERDFPGDHPVETPAEPESPVESATSEPPPPPEPPAAPPAGATGCNQMQQDSQISNDIAPPEAGCALGRGAPFHAAIEETNSAASTAARGEPFCATSSIVLQPGLRSRPVPADALKARRDLKARLDPKARRDHQRYLDLCALIDSGEPITVEAFEKIERRHRGDAPADAKADEEEIPIE
jgi:hypothetical protein